MINRLVTLKKFSCKNNVILSSVYIVFSIIETLQNTAFLFNPFILVLLCTSYIISLPTFMVSLISMLITSLFINVNYFIELLLVGITVFIISLITTSDCNKKKLLIRYSTINLIFFLIYFFTAKGLYYRLNSAILMIISTLITYVLSDIIMNVNYTKKVNKFYYGLMFSLIGILYYKNTYATLVLSCLVMFTLIKIDREIATISLLFLFILMIWLTNISLKIELLFLIVFSFVLLINIRYYELIFVIFVLFGYCAIYQRFMIDNTYWCFLTTALISFCVPNKIFDRFNLNEKEDNLQNITYQNENNEKLEDIKKLSYLLMDSRFETNDDLETQLTENIKNNICLKCNKNNECLINLRKYLFEEPTGEEKSKINEECLYSSMIIKEVMGLHRKVSLYFEKESILNENKKIMNDAFSIINKLANSKSQKLKLDEKKYSISFESISKPYSHDNGDNFIIDENDNNVNVILSDGMGHNKKSKDISEYLTLLIKYLYSATLVPGQSIEDANRILLAKTYEELYATLDFANFDLSEGLLKLYKAGSFTTFMIRDKELIEMSTKNPPLGIVSNVNIIPYNINLKAGDIILFMTDGFGNDANDFIKKNIQKSWFLPLKSYLKFLYNKLSSCVEDDKTIIGLKIKEL